MHGHVKQESECFTSFMQVILRDKEIERGLGYS